MNVPAWPMDHARDYTRESLGQLISTRFCTSDVALGGAASRCKARLEQVPLGSVQVLRYFGTGVQRASRRRAHIQQDHDDHYMLYLPLTAQVSMAQDARSTRLSPGTFAIVAMSRPFEGAVFSHDADAPYATLHVRMPASLVRERLPRVDLHCNRSFPIGPGASRLMTRVLESAWLDGALLSEDHAASLGRTVLDVIASAVQAGAGPGDEERPRAGRSQAIARVREYIESNLSRSGLTTTSIAQGCGMSVRYLHSLFEGTGSTVASLVRELRLERCRQALRDPALGDHSVTEIAFAWGFNDASHFSRAYKQRFGHAPSAERRVH